MATKCDACKHNVGESCAAQLPAWAEDAIRQAELARVRFRLPTCEFSEHRKVSSTFPRVGKNSVDCAPASARRDDGRSVNGARMACYRCDEGQTASWRIYANRGGPR